MPLTTRPRVNASIAVLLALVSTGCNRTISREAVVGSYELKQEAGTIDLELNSDGSFSEVVRLKNAQVSLRRGRWSPPSPDSPLIGIDGLLIPREFTPDYIKEADHSNRNGVKYSDPGYWVLRPSYEFGTITIPVFPDAGIRFVKKSPLSN